MPNESIKATAITLIYLVLLFLFSDQISYSLQSVSPTNQKTCPEFNSTVTIFKKTDNGYVYSNGVLVDQHIILTAKHTAIDKDFQIFANDQIYSSQILGINNIPDQDLTILQIKGDIDLPPAKISIDMKPPFTLVTTRSTKVYRLYAGKLWRQDGDLIFFSNSVSLGGDSGAPLLNKSCEVVAIVYGGQHSFLGEMLRPTSQYTPLKP
jgi:hypothetical protein